LAIRLDSVLEAVKLPAGVTNLDSGLSDVNRDDFSHFSFELSEFNWKSFESDKFLLNKFG